MRCVALLIAIAACRDDVTVGRYQGMVELEQSDLAFERAGRIVELSVEAGAEVQRDQQLARLDSTLDRQTRDVRAKELEVARAELALAVAGSRDEDIRAGRARVSAARVSEQVAAREVERERKLVDEDASPATNLDRLVGELARARGEREVLEESLRELVRGTRSEELRRVEERVAVARENLVLAERALDKYVLVAPIAGAVIDVYPELGEVVAAGTPVVSLVVRGRPYADVFVPVSDAPKVRLGAAVEVVVEGDPRAVQGVVERIYPHLEFTPRFVYSPRERPNLVVRVRIRIDDREGRLHAGLPAYARLVEPVREATL